MSNQALRKYVQDRLAGNIATPGGRTIAGPQVSWNGRRQGRRQARRWSRAWSPQQISNRLPIDFPEDTSMRISHEAIYQALYVQGRGALQRELTACLRTGRALRVPRERVRARGKSFVTPEIMISERPASVEDRAVPGHWEGDLILGLDSSAIGTLVERTTRFTMLLYLPPQPGHRQQPRDKHGPALAGHGAEAVRDGDYKSHEFAAKAAEEVSDLGSGSGDGPARETLNAHWPTSLFLRSAKSLAERHQREHQWAVAPILPKGHGPQRASSN